MPLFRRSPTSQFVRARDHPETFADLYVTYRDPVLAFVGREVLDPETSYDLMAETFARACRDINGFRGSTDAEGRAWLWTIARNVLYRWRERGVIERRSLEALGIERGWVSDSEFEHAEELIDLARLRPAIRDALDNLAPEQRDAIRLRVLNELDYGTIAAELGVTSQVVRARVSRGLRELSVVLTPRHTEGEAASS